ncbi:MAG: anthranilate phosphoribosyltransferase [Planctomycetota bacterium]|nr:anthranilate phosphoribosyltransferase [Planctomycetota bacterium]
MQEILRTLLERRSLNEADARRAFSLILSGQANESQVGAMLALIASRGPALEEVVGGALEMRAHAQALPIAADDPVRATLIDTCGTGGAPKTFNVSTGAALVAASARARDGRRAYVAKHGGRSRSGRGSAEVLAALGVNIDAAPATQARCLRECGVCFSFAVNHHPAMRFAAGPRKSLGFPTIFNLMGPLSNPAGARRQLIGVYDERYVALIAQALARLGAERAMVVHGLDGMDEITTTNQTMAAIVDARGSIETLRLDAISLGIDRASLADLEAPTLELAVGRLRDVLGGARGAARDITMLNAAAALFVAGVADALEPALGLAEDAIDSGRAAETLRSLARLSHEPA